MSEDKLAEFRRLAEGAVVMADYEDLQRRGTARRTRQWVTGLGAAAAVAVVALAVAQPWAGGTNASPSPMGSPSDSPSTSAEPTTVPVSSGREYEPGDVIEDEIEFCRTEETICPDGDVVTATVRLTVAGRAWQAYNEGDVVNLATHSEDEKNWAAVTWTPLYGWATTQLCREGQIDREDMVAVGSETPGAVPGVTFGRMTDTTFGGRPAQQVVLEHGDLCEGFDTWLLVTSGDGELRDTARVADDPGPLTVTLVPLPEVGDSTYLAFYDFNGDSHDRTPQQLEEREAIKESLTITVE